MAGEKSLKDRLKDFLERNYPNWVASGEIQRIVVLKTNYTGRTVARRLGELAQAGKIDARYGRKNHVWYRFRKPVVIRVSAKKPIPQQQELKI